MKKVILVLFAFAIFASAALAQTDTVILVSDTTNVDMMIAKAAGEKEGVPVLVLENGMLSDGIKAQLSNLTVKNVILVGGPVVIKPEVQTELEGLGYNVVRLWGAERTGTAIEVASYFWKGGSKCVVLADDTKNSDKDAETQAEASQDAAINGCPFVPVPNGTIPTEVLELIRNLNAQEARFVGRAASAEFHLRLGRLRMVELIGNKTHVQDELDDEAEELAHNESRPLKLVVVAAPNWKDIMGSAGHEGRHTLVRIVSNASTVPDLVDLVHEYNITIVFVVGNPSLSQEIASQLEAAGINLMQVSGNAAEVARKALKETIKNWEEIRRHSIGNDTLIRQQIQQYLLDYLNRTKTRLDLLETELANLNSSSINQSRIQRIQQKIDAAQSQISAVTDYIQNGNFDLARMRMAKMIDSVEFLRWLYRAELKIDRIRDVRKEESDDDKENEGDISNIEARLAGLKTKCNSTSIEAIIERARSIRASIEDAKAQGDYIRAAELSIELRGVVERTRYLSNTCERLGTPSNRIEIMNKTRENRSTTTGSGSSGGGGGY